MKTIENKNNGMNFSNELIKNRKITLRNKSNKSSNQIEKTLKKLSASNLYVATDTGPFKSLFSFKDSQSAKRADDGKNNISKIGELISEAVKKAKKTSKYAILLSLHLMLSPQVVESITVLETERKDIQARIMVVATARNLGEQIYLLEKKKEKRGRKRYSYYSKPSERLGGIGIALNKEAWDSTFQETLNFIKKHEGWNKGVAYLDVCGIKTIGYGHVITKYDNLPDKITQTQSDSILSSDYSKALRACDRETNLRGTKRLAIAHFIFAKGIGSFNRSKVKQKVLAGEDIEAEILEWCTYRGTNGKTYHSEYSKNIRRWEVKMYNR